jgi:RNA polymerase sigma-70 factor (ECF subfamily)
MNLELESAIRARFDAGDLDAAMTCAIEGYGDEIFGFLIGLSGDRDRAGDAFGAACERAWRALPKFRWDSSMRVWLYTIARNEFLRVASRQKKLVPLSAAPSVIEAIVKVRTATPVEQRTEVKEQLAKIRAGLAPDDHMLLGLRLDRRLEWNDIARVLGSGREEDLAREAAALRKRYERLKTKLRALAQGG